LTHRRHVARDEELALAQGQEEVRDVWLTRWLRDFVYDLRFSADLPESYVLIGSVAAPASARRRVRSSPCGIRRANS